MRINVTRSFNVMRLFYTGSGLYFGLAINGFIDGRWFTGGAYVVLGVVWYLLGFAVERSYLFGYMWKCDHQWKRAKGIPNAEACECGAVRFTDEG